jgi:hypothetical protein
MNRARNIAKYLLKRYSEWTAEPLKPGEKYKIGYLKWLDLDARAAYWLICDLWRFPREG